MEHLRKRRLSEFKGDHSVITLCGDDAEQDEADQGIAADDAIILKVDANLVTIKKVHTGVLLLTKTWLLFQATESPKHRRIALGEIADIYVRFYLLTNTSIEIFTTNRRSYFIDFIDEEQRMKILIELKNMKLLKCQFLQMSDRDLEPIINRVTNRWRRRKISNFDYLMQLNKLSGRTYNDLGQYPVFPWVISGYQSTTLDLDDTTIFRNLTVPIGAMSPERLQPLIERMAFVEREEERCLFQAFYSSQAVVIGFLIRQEPFTSLHIEFQSGRFDQQGRLFTSIPRAWESVVHSTMDFRELIPEFFYSPDFLINSNGFDLGQDVGDGELPPWASSAHDFITKNRAALESPFVTAFLPRWIDMIFGFTSRGCEAESINNIFSPYFYPEVITPAIRSDQERFAFARNYAACFGQASARIFSEAHPSRTAISRSITGWASKCIILTDSGNQILSLEVTHESITWITRSFELFVYRRRDSVISKAQLLLNAEITDAVLPMMRSLVQTAAGFALTGVPWDTAFTLSNTQGLALHIKRLHSQKLSAVALSEHFFATASFDWTVML
jgi:hypothetical protein